MSCSYCGKSGHNILTCPVPRRCSICGRPYHNKRTCEYRQENKDVSTDYPLGGSQLDVAKDDVKLSLPEGFHLVPARFLRVHDGDTIVVSVDSKHGLGDKDIWVRMRGIDAPESNPNTDKFEREYDHFNGSQRQMLALGKRSTDKLIDLLNNEDSMSLICEPVDRGAKPYLHHRQYRLLAYLFGKNGNDIGRELIEFGFAVVWPRNIPSRKYLHPKTDGYIQACNIARNNSEGLWGRGLEYLCPATKETKGSITLDKCIECCHPNKKNIT